MSQVEQFFKIIIGAGVGVVVIYILHWFSGVKSQERKNEVNEIDLSLKKINLDVHSKPVDQLVADSNKSHGVGQSFGADTADVVKVSGDDDSNGTKGPI